MTLASIPSPSTGVWYLGPIPIRAYALCIIAGVLVAVWAVPFGIVGGRIYHVITDPELYFGSGPNWRPLASLYIWEGGLGIWGAVALGALGAYIGCRRRGLRFSAFADAVAPAIALGQAIGRWGNYFNQELYGKPTTLPWGLEIDRAHRGDLQRYSTFQPTFLYESLWDLGVAGLVIWADRRYRLGHGRAFALYVMAYTAGRCAIEYLRVDQANLILGVRLNLWTSILVFFAAATYFAVSARRAPGRELNVEPGDTDPLPAEAGDSLRSGQNAEDAARDSSRGVSP